LIVCWLGIIFYFCIRFGANVVRNAAKKGEKITISRISHKGVFHKDRRVYRIVNIVSQKFFE
jgi:hypothetical protein